MFWRYKGHLLGNHLKLSLLHFFLLYSCFSSSNAIIIGGRGSSLRELWERKDPVISGAGRTMLDVEATWVKR